MSLGKQTALYHAQPVAESLRDALAPACQRIEIVGSVRRQRPMVSDIELLCIPLGTTQSDMFGAPLGRISQLDDLLDQFVARGVWTWDKGQPRQGEKWKRLYYRTMSLTCDIFIVSLRSWAGNLLVRTGPSAYSQHVMSAARRKGWHFADGFLLHRHAGPCGRGPECANILDVSDERSILDVLGLPWREPNQRDGLRPLPPKRRQEEDED